MVITIVLASFWRGARIETLEIENVDRDEKKGGRGGGRAPLSILKARHVGALFLKRQEGATLTISPSYLNDPAKSIQ